MRLVIKDRAADAVAQARRGDDQLSIGPASLHGLRNAELGKTLVAGRIALIHRQEALVAGDQSLGGVVELLGVHFASPHFQLRISGMS